MKKVLSMILAALLTFSLTVFTPALGASGDGFGTGVVYVDGDYAGVTSDGTKAAPYTTIKAGADSLGTAGGTVVLMGHVLMNSSQHFGGAGSAGILITSVDPTDGTDYRASGAIIEYSKAIYPDTDTILENVSYYNGGSSTYLNASGHHLTLGSGVAPGSIGGTASPDGIRLRGGSDGLSCDSTCLELSVGGDVAKKTYVGSAGAGCVYGDATLIIRSGLYSSTGLINFGNSSKKTGAAIGGNANLIVYGIGSGSKIDPSASVDSLGGSANFVFNNGTYALLDSSTTVGAAVSTLASKGVYIIDSAVGGTVVPLATTVTDTVANDTHGKFVITTDHTDIFVNGTAITRNASDVYDLGSAGTYVITYEDSEPEPEPQEEDPVLGNGVVYVNGDYAGATSDGTKTAPYTTFKAAADSLGAEGGTVVLTGHILTNASQHLGGAGSAGILITSVDPTDGTDYRSSGAILEYSKALYPDTDTVFENINFYNGGSSAYVNTSGHHFVLGNGTALGSIGGTDSPYGVMLRGGSDNLNVENTMLELYVGDSIAKKTYIGSAGAGCVYGDVNLTIHGGLFSSTGTINFGNSSKKAGAAIGGNANLVVYGIGSGSKINPSANADSLAGAANFVFNNGTYALLDASTTVGAAVSTLASKGVYIIDSAVGGTVVPLATTVTNNVANDTHGKFVITTDHTDILVNGTAITRNDSDVYDLGSAGTYVITYADLSGEKSTVSGKIVLAREAGDTAVSIARMLILDGDGKVVVEEALEDESTDTSSLSFAYELSEGTYTAQITKNGYLPFEFSFTVGEENAVIPDITLIPGDIVESTDAICGNGKVDVNDFIRVVRGLSASSSIREYVDINEDGAVTVADIALLKASFGEEAECTVVPGSYTKKITLTNDGKEADVVPASVRSYLTETFANPVIDYTSDAYTNVKMAACDPVTFSWSYDNFRPTSALLTIATKPDFSDAKEYTVSGSSYTLGNVYTGTTYYWKVRAEADGREVESKVGTLKVLPGPRMLSVSGAYNMRDVGAWMTEDGRPMKQGLLIRSARFDTIGTAGIATMVGDMGIKTELDLRGSSSLNEFGYTEHTGPLGSAVKYVNLAGSFYANALTSDATRAALALIADIDNYPIVYHCLGGADRTGTLSVLVQALCGCDEVTVVADFELTNERGRNYAQFPLLMSTLKGASGSTLREKTEDIVLKLGCTRMQISNIYNILMTDSAIFTGTSLTAPTVSGNSRTFTLDLRESGGIAGVTVLGEDVGFELSGNTLTVNAASGDGVITLCDGETLRF